MKNVSEENQRLFWDFIKELDWNKGCNHKASNLVLRSKPKKEQKILEKVFKHYMEKLNEFPHVFCSDLPWQFLRSGIIATGEKYYNEMTKEKIRYMIETKDYIECFSYTFH